MDNNKKRKEKVWFKDICFLLDKSDIIPNNYMSKDEKINTITRLSLLIFSCMVVVKYKYSVTFLSLSLIIILILYFINTKEYFDMEHTPMIHNPLIAQNSKAIRKMSLQPLIFP